MRMSMPCRPTTCDHLQCFDASLFLMMNEKKPTWTCPVCDSAAKYDDLMIDGYFQDEVIKSAELPEEENEIILNQDGSWNPVPKDEEEERKEKEEEEKKNAVVIDFSDDDDDTPAAPKPAADADAAPAPPPVDLPVLPPPPPAEIECIDIE